MPILLPFRFNTDRHFQVGLLTSRLHSAGANPTDIVLLYHIAAQFRKQGDGAHGYFCSQLGLAEDVHLSVTTVNKCIKFLVSNGFLLQEYIPPSPVAMYRPTPMWSLLPEIRAQKEDKEAMIAVFNSRENPNEVIATPPEPPQVAIEGVAYVYHHLQMHYGEHTSFQRRGAEAMLTRIVEKLLPEAGSADMMVTVLSCLSDERKRALRSSRKLGGFLRDAFPFWLREYLEENGGGPSDAAEHTAYGTIVTTICATGGGYTCDSFAKLTPHLREWLEEAAGPHLLDYVLTEGNGGEHLHLALTSQFRTWWLLVAFSGESLLLSDIPGDITEREVLQLGQDSELCPTSNVLEWFLESRREMASSRP